MSDDGGAPFDEVSTWRSPPPVFAWSVFVWPVFVSPDVVPAIAVGVFGFVCE